MLYNPEWEVEVKADPFSLASLIAWLEKQPADKTYLYYDNCGCLLHQYFSAMGFADVEMGGFELWHGPDRKMIVLPRSFIYIPAEAPLTFGAALERARAAVQS